MDGIGRHALAGIVALAGVALSGPFLRLFLEMAGYTLWGIGLLVACASYVALTRPPCPRLFRRAGLTGVGPAGVTGS